MSTFQQLSAHRSLNVSDITNALKAGGNTVEEAASLLDHATIHARAEASQLDGHLSLISEVWITQTPRNPHEGLKVELSDREHIGAYHRIMELRGCS